MEKAKGDLQEHPRVYSEPLRVVTARFGDSVIDGFDADDFIMEDGETPSAPSAAPRVKRETR